MDCFEEFLAGFLELLRSLVVADLERNGVGRCQPFSNRSAHFSM